MATSVPITTNAVTVTDNGSTVDVAVTQTAVSVDVGVTGPQGATGPGVAVGGTTGQYLRKSSSTDYDTGWDTLTTSDVSGLDSALAGKAPYAERVSMTAFDHPTAAVGANGIGTGTGYYLRAARTNTGSTPANTHYLEYQVGPIKAGTYRLDIGTFQNANGGILTIDVDGTTLGTTVDLYAASGGVLYASITGITVASDGLTTVKFAVPTKNGSASTFGYYLSAFSLTRTGA